MDFKEQISFIESNIKKLSIDNIKEILNPYHIGTSIQCPIFEKGTFVFRARPISNNFNKNIPLTYKDFSYPPTSVGLGRANREGTPMFYCSSGKEVVFFELDVKTGDEFLLGNWILNNKLLANNIGYTEECFLKLSASRPVPDWNGPIGSGKITLDANAELKIEKKLKALRKSDPQYNIQNLMGLEFIRKDKSMHKLTAAIAEMHLGTIVNSPIEFGGIIYPSVRMSANGDNLALLPSYVDKNMSLARVSHIKVNERKGTTISFSEIDHAVSFSPEGYPEWKGRTLRWTSSKQGELINFVVEAGHDDFGYYELGKDGYPLHWQAYNEDGSKRYPD